mmetsp:Transcript_91283/g.230222  ORF Transcript_91283/g.230222 Transcript_91283/m.230222 type:complete len:211 (-) Transcript_91283:50-682(-)
MRFHMPVALRDEGVVDAAGHWAFAGDLEAIGQEVSNAVVSVVAVHVAVRVGGDDRGQVLHTQLLAQSQDHFGRMLVSLTSIRARALIVQAPVRAEEHKGLALPLQLGIAHEALGVAVRPFLSKVLVAAEAPEGNHPRLVEDAIECVRARRLQHTVTQRILQLVLIHALLQASHVSLHVVGHDVRNLAALPSLSAAKVRVQDVPAQNPQAR